MITKPLGILDPEGKYLNPLNNRPYTDNYRGLAKNIWTKLVCYKRRNEFFKLLNDNQVVIVISGTGTGKTVIFPKLISHYFNYKNPIITTIPTRKPIPGVAAFAAATLDVELGYEVAYAMGGEQVYYAPDRTKLLYATDGYIAAMLQSDPLLSNYSAIIIDEVHTRGASIDILLANVAKIALVRPEFKIIPMSATIDPAEFIDFFKRAGLKFDLFELPGVPNQPVEHIFNTKKLKVNEVQKDALVDKIEEVLINNSEGNIVAFVSAKTQGSARIRELNDRLRKNPKKYPNIPLVGMVHSGTEEDYKKIMLGETSMDTIPPGPFGKYTRRVIFATEAIEFSVTFEDDCKFVIDSGVKFGVVYDFNLNCYKMETQFTAKSNVAQRCGRTGRKTPGTCIRMYSKQQFKDEFRDYAIPAILLNDISDNILGFLSIERTNNYKKCMDFLDSMIAPIPEINRRVTFKKLIEHNIVNLKGKLTPLGIMITNLKEPTTANFELKKMIIASYYFNCMGNALKLVCILSNINSFGDLITPDQEVFIDRQQSSPVINKTVNKFAHPSGDFLTLLKIYDSTLEYTDDIKQRKEFCKEHHINYKTIEKIDELYFSLISSSEGTIMDLIPFISILNLFDITNSPKHAKKLEYYRLEEYRDPLKYIMMKGSGRKSSRKKTKKLKRSRYTKRKTKKPNQPTPNLSNRNLNQKPIADIINDKKIKSVKELDKIFKKQEKIPEFKYKELPKYRHPYSDQDKQRQPFNKDKQRQPFNKDKQRQPFNKDNKSFKKFDKFNKDKKPFNKFNKFNKKLPSYVDEALKKIKTYKAPDKPRPDFIKNYKKMKEKEKEERMKLLKPEKNFKQTSSKKDKGKSKSKPKPKQEGKPKKPKRKQNLDLAKLIDAELSKVTLIGQSMGFPIKISDNHEENLLACIFYAFNTNIAAMVNGTDCIYQVKNTPYLEIKLRSLEGCALNNFPDKKPEMLVFNKLTFSTFSNSAEPGFANKISSRILNKFGLSYTPPKWEK